MGLMSERSVRLIKPGSRAGGVQRRLSDHLAVGKGIRLGHPKDQQRHDAGQSHANDDSLHLRANVEAQHFAE